MKISYNWLKQFFNDSQTDGLNKTPAELSLILTNIGLEVESVQLVQAVSGGLEGLITGVVKTCVAHANADRLRVTTVDVGGPEILQIVCGAPNVAEGQKVIVATVGTTLYPLNGEPFKITKSKIRGEVSEGMICAEDEIGIGVSHDGIIVLNKDVPVGQPAKDQFQLNDDFIFEIGLTPNRADAASHLGVARDIAAFLRISLVAPDNSAFSIADTSSEILVEIENKEACKRYASLTISGLTVQPSPEWLQEKLKLIGVRPINNVVDVTNYVLHDLGQPLHAFDLDKISGGKVFVKNYPDGTLFRGLDDVERKLSSGDLVIADAMGPMCLAGVFGGNGSGVSEATTRIFLESAYFDAVSVRKSSKRHNLKTDASFRFERGTDPEMVIPALKRAALLISELAGGKVTSSISDFYPTVTQPHTIEVRFSNISKLIGADIPPSEIIEIIKALSIGITNSTEDGLTLSVPAYRVDVTRECDIVEEVLRIYGYDNIPIPTKINASLSTGERPNKENTQHTIADMLTANGFAEIWCNSLTKSDYATEPEQTVRILNALSSDLDSMRQSLLHPALEVVAYNQNRKNTNNKLYEFGKTYHLIDGKYVERPRLLLLIAGNKQTEQWNQSSKEVDFYDLKAAVDGVLNRLGIANLQSESLSDKEFDFGTRYYRGDRTIVRFGAVTRKDRQSADIDKSIFYADFDWFALLSISAKNRIINKDVPKFPAVRRDISMLIDKEVSFDQIRSVIFKTDRKWVKDVQIFDVFEGAGKVALPENKKSYAVSLLLLDEEQTLTDKQIDTVMQKIIHNLDQNIHAEIRK